MPETYIPKPVDKLGLLLCLYRHLATLLGLDQVEPEAVAIFLEDTNAHFEALLDQLAAGEP